MKYFTQKWGYNFGGRTIKGCYVCPTNRSKLIDKIKNGRRPRNIEHGTLKYNIKLVDSPNLKVDILLGLNHVRATFESYMLLLEQLKISMPSEIINFNNNSDYLFNNKQLS